MALRKIIAKKIGYPIQDYLKGTNIIRTIEFLRESQYWSEEKIDEYQFLKLKKLINYSYSNVPYYKNLFSNIRLHPNDIKTWADYEKIPVLTKDVVRDQNQNLISQNFNMKHVKHGKTGGTTGTPIIVLKDRANRSFTWASYYKWYDWMGIEYGDTTINLWGDARVLNSSFYSLILSNGINFLQNKKNISSFNMNESNLFDIYRDIKRNNPVILKGYVSALIQLAEYINDRNLDPIIPKALSTTTETLLPYHRRFLSEVFNAPIFDQYGCGEVSAISYECGQHNGLHVNQEHVILEILDEEGNPLIEQKGRVIATDLDNYVMPFIRYENGDISSVSHRKCKCGVNQPLMGPIEGRAATSIVLTNGSKVHGVFFTDILFELNITTDEINRFQVFQEEAGKIQFRVETKNTLSKSLKDKLINALKRFFSEVDIAECAHLENEPNGKFLYMKRGEHFQD